MALGSKKALVQKLERLDKKLEMFVPNETLMAQQRLANQEAIIDAQVGNLEKNVWSTWILLNLWTDYFANRFQYRIVEPYFIPHMKFINRVLRWGYIYGEIGVAFILGKPFLCSIRERTFNKARVGIIYDITENNFETVYEEKDNEKIIDSEDLIVYRFQENRMGALIYLQPVIEIEKYIQKALKNEMIALPTRIINDRNQNTSDTAAEAFIKLTSTLIKRFDGGQETFSGITLETNTQSLIDLIEYCKNWYYEVLGRRTNTEFKKERTIAGENVQTQVAFQATEQEHWVNFFCFIREYAAKVGCTILAEDLNGEMIEV